MRRQRCGDGPVGVVSERTGRALGRFGRLWLVTAMAAGCAAAVEPGPDNLRASFAAQIDSVESVSGVEHTGDTLTFTETQADGTEVQWRVVIDSAAVAPPAVEGAPTQGNVVSSWYADGELIEPLGSMSRLPDAFLDAGIAQDCWALWDADAGRWGWT
jgi:hypothetical protein